MKRLAFLLLLPACAPPTAMPPPLVGAASGEPEVGVAGMGGAWFEDRCVDGAGCPVVTTPAVAAQAYGTLHLGAFDFGGTGFLGTQAQDPTAAALLGAGVFGRYRLTGNEAHYLGIQLGAGWAYWQLAVPYAKRIGNGLWVYTAPAWGSSNLAAAQFLPVGLSYEIDAQLRIHAEVGTEVHLLDPAERDHLLLYGALGVSVTP